MVKSLFSCFSAKKPKPRAVIVRRTISYNELRDVLRDFFGEKCTITMNDSEYGLLLISDVQAFLKYDTTSKLKFHPESRDCDDYGLILIGHFKEYFHANSTIPRLGSAFGWITGDLRKNDDDGPRMHAMNFMVDPDLNVWLIEPQNNDIMRWIESSTAINVIV